jgi:hypothetical protein
MKGKPAKAAEFLAAMQQADTAPAAAPPVSRDTTRTPISKPSSRVGLKHFGGYLDDETLEKIALLRARLKKDNSALIKLAIDDLYRKHQAKRAFGDA